MIKKAVVFAACLASGVSLAQSVRPSYSFPTASTTGGRMLSAYAGLGIGHDDNLFLSPTNEKSSTFYVFSPGLNVEARRPSLVFQGSYLARIGRYTDSGNDDYEDLSALNQLDFAFGPRTFGRLGLDYIRGHDSRGSTDRPLSATPDKYDLLVPSFVFAYGAPGARGRVEVYGSLQDKEYTNNRATTATADHQRSELGTALFVRIAPKTYGVLEGRRIKTKYEVASLSDGRENRLLAGVSWEPTAATTGSLKFGRMERKSDIDSSSVRDTAWEAAIAWAPLTYSKFDFASSRHIQEPSGLGRFIVTSAHSVAWNHAWNSNFSTGAFLRYARDEYQGFDREDETTSLGFRVGYRFRRWLTLGAEYTYTHRDSTLPQFEYDRNFYSLTATASM